MKRSRSIELALMGAVPLLLTACHHRESIAATPSIYQNVQECVDDGKIDADTCKKEYDSAWEEHKRTAPRFTNMNDCAAQFGYNQCYPATMSNGVHMFIPALAGYMIGRAMTRRDYDYGYQGGGYYGGNGWKTQPIYRERGDRGAWRNGQGDRVGYGEGARGPAAATTAETLSRGGFGHSSAAKGSWGG